MKGTALAIILALAAATPTEAITRQELADYYKSADGLKKAELKTALSTLLQKHTDIPYGNGSNNTTWGAFYVTDRTADNKVVNRYSPEEFSFSSRGSAVSGMNIEHSFPKSWWGGSKNAAYRDLFNLYPSPSDDNSQKSNYPMGKVTDVKHDSGEGYDKVGYGTLDGSRQQCWEPGDGWKGDFARAYMYMAVCYQGLSWVKTGLVTLQAGDYPSLRDWAQTLYRQWSAADKVDNIETKRNNDVQGIQKNRNPFVDFPFLCEYIWGDSADVAFNLSTAVTTASDDSRYGTYTPSEPDPEPGPEPEPSPYFYYADCKTNFGSMEESIESGSLDRVWTQTTKYGWKASAYVSGKACAAEATLTTPEIDLTDGKTATLTFSHAVNFTKTPSEDLSVEVECDGETRVLSVPNWPEGKNWTFVESGDVSLDDFAGKVIRLIFRYTSTSSVASTWEIKEVKVSGEKKSTALPDTYGKPAAPDYNEPYEAYTLSGARIADVSEAPGAVIIRQGGHTWLIVRKK